MKINKIILCFILMVALTMSGTVIVFASENGNSLIVAETNAETDTEKTPKPDVESITEEAVETPPPEEEPDPPSLTIQNVPATMEVGETASLSTTLNNTSDDNVSWKSSDPDILAVDSSGKLTAKAPGSATITGSISGASDKVSITVKEIEPESIKIVSDDFSLTSAVTGYELKVGDVIHLQVEVEPKEATVSGITWQVSDPEIAKIDEYGVLTALNNGEVTITANTDNDIDADIDIKVSSNIPWVMIAIIIPIVLLIIILIIAIIRKKIRDGRSGSKRQAYDEYDDDDEYEDEVDGRSNQYDQNRSMTQEEFEQEKERLRQEAYRQGYEARDREMTRVFNPKDFEPDKDDDMK